MQKTETYQKYHIDARAHERVDGKGWIAEVYVAQHLNGETIDTVFYLKDQTFETAEQAISAAIEAAKKQIDAGIKPTSVTDAAQPQ